VISAAAANVAAAQPTAGLLQWSDAEGIEIRFRRLTKPEVQKPHCCASWPQTAAEIGCNLPSGATPRWCEFPRHPAASIQYVQEVHGFSIHLHRARAALARSQTFFAPVKSRLIARASMSVTRGSTLICRLALIFSVMANRYWPPRLCSRRIVPALRRWPHARKHACGCDRHARSPTSYLRNRAAQSRFEDSGRSSAFWIIVLEILGSGSLGIFPPPKYKWLLARTS